MIKKFCNTNCSNISGNKCTYYFESKKSAIKIDKILNFGHRMIVYTEDEISKIGSGKILEMQGDKFLKRNRCLELTK